MSFILPFFFQENFLTAMKYNVNNYLLKMMLIIFFLINTK